MFEHPPVHEPCGRPALLSHYCRRHGSEPPGAPSLMSADVVAMIDADARWPGLLYGWSNWLRRSRLRVTPESGLTSKMIPAQKARVAPIAGKRIGGQV